MDTNSKNNKNPYWAVIFTSKRTDVDEGYFDMAEKMVESTARVQV